VTLLRASKHRNAIGPLLRKAKAFRDLRIAARDLDHLIALEKLTQDADLLLPKGAFRGLSTGFEEESKKVLVQTLFAETRAGRTWSDMMAQVGGLDQKLVTPVPAGWRREFEQLGFKVDHFRSVLAFALLHMRSFARAGAKLRRYLHKAIAAKAPAPQESFAVFCGVRPCCLPEASIPPSNRWDWISWYRRSPVFDARIKEIWAVIDEPHHGKDLKGVRPVEHPLPDLASKGEWLAFFLEAAARSAWAAVRWPFGAWWAPLVLPQVIDLCYSRRVRRENLPLHVMFSSVLKTIRPLWTYDLERRATRVMMFLYSMNNAAFAPRSPQVRFSDPDLCNVSWPEYIVWGEPHIAMLKRIGVRHGTFTTVGAIGFADDAAGDLQQLPGNCVAVFDVEAQRDVDLALQGMPRPYWDHETSFHFVERAFAAIRAQGATPVYKPKGYLDGKLIRPKARAFRELVERYGAILVDGYINPNRVIPKVNAVVSMPFTSTGAAALVFNRPSAYFDPTATLAPYEMFACGIPLLLSQEDLARWLGGVLTGQAGPELRQSVR